MFAKKYVVTICYMEIRKTFAKKPLECKEILHFCFSWNFPSTCCCDSGFCLKPGTTPGFLSGFITIIYDIHRFL